MGKSGVWASNARYRWQCWTRDFIIAVLPLLLDLDINKGTAKRHLDALAKRQKSNGQIPILFIESPIRWTMQKVIHSIKNGRMSFMLKKYLSSDGVFNLTSWTKDSEILYLLGVAVYYRRTRDLVFWERHCPHVDKAVKYIKNELSYQGLVYGTDWRDTKPEFNRVMLLTNNCFLFEAYKQLGMHLEADNLRDMINKHFWTGKYYRDFIGTDNFDTLGNALAVIFKVASSDKLDSVIEEAMKMNTEFGFKLNSVTLPPKNEAEKKLMERINQDGVIWPFISGFMVIALYKAGKRELAVREFDKWSQVSGFYEFYNPNTGEGHGSSDQLWSASLYLRLAKLLGKVDGE